MMANPFAYLLPDSSAVSSEGVFHIASHSLPDLARQYGTPLYIFDRATIVHVCQEYRRAFDTYYHASPVEILYASKAYLSPRIAIVMAEQGMGLDVVSGGELMVARQAGFPVERISFHGNNKSEDELCLALELGVGRIVLDNWHELEWLTRLARDANRQPGVLLRVAPDVHTDTHRYLQTGHAASKFGFPLGNGEAKAAILRILAEKQLRLLGLHAHIGTMLREARPYIECIERLFGLAREVFVETNWWPEEISPGGGWAIDTVDAPEFERMPGVEVLAQALQVAVAGQSQMPVMPVPTLVIEPGRSIIARAAIAVYRVGARKSTPGGPTYLFVDGGMADNIRPALYGARYTALPAERVTAPSEETVCVAGRYCESGDVLIEQVLLPRMREGELLVLPTAGAYCLPMASNYNMVPRPAVLLVDEEKVEVMEQRETYMDMLARYS